LHGVTSVCVILLFRSVCGEKGWTREKNGGGRELHNKHLVSFFFSMSCPPFPECCGNRVVACFAAQTPSLLSAQAPHCCCCCCCPVLHFQLQLQQLSSSLRHSFLCCARPPPFHTVRFTEYHELLSGPLHPGSVLSMSR